MTSSKAPREQTVLRWLIHPAVLAGDLWHIASALVCDSSTRLVAVVHQEIYEAYLGASSLEHFLARGETTLAAVRSNMESAPRPPRPRKADAGRRLDDSWMQTMALLELLSESGVDARRYWVIPFHKEYDATADPYQPAAKAVLHAGKLKDVGGWRARTGDPVPFMARGDFVGITQSSTSVIAHHLHSRGDDALTLIRDTLAPEPRQEHVLEIQEIVKKVLPPESRVLLVSCRVATENKSYNTTLSQLKRVLRMVARYNETHERPYLVRPMGLEVASSKKSTAIDEIEQLRSFRVSPGAATPDGAKCLLPAYDLLRNLQAIDRGARVRLCRRSLITEFWRQVAATGSASLIGGRSGSVDVAAFMGVRCASWDFGQPDHDHQRLCLTHRVMGIVDLLQRKPDTAALEAFLEETPMPRAWLDRISASTGFRTVHRFRHRKHLPRAAVQRTMTASNKARGWALLLFDDREPPWSGETAAQIFKSHATVKP